MKNFNVISRFKKIKSRFMDAFLLLDKNWWRHKRLKYLGVSDQAEESKKNDQYNFVSRKYRNYRAYIEHQKSKISFLNSGGKYKHDGTNLIKYDIVFRKSLSDRLKKMEIIKQYTNVLCLAARIGTEVKAFHDCGFFAVGIDLNPGTMNEYVLYGDFNKLIFPNSSIDIVYCNSFDHAYSIEILLAEIKRVLHSRGLLIAEVQIGEMECDRKNMGYWESISWKYVSDIEKLINCCGFKVKRGFNFMHPWPGIQLIARHDDFNL